MFKLIEIEFINHPFFKSLPISFIGEGEEEIENFISLIIGPNGTGKSKIMLCIIEIFNSLNNLKNNPSKKYSFEYNYKLKYLQNGIIQDLDYSTNVLLINGQSTFYYVASKADKDVFTQTPLPNLILPNKLLVSAFSFNDKYPLREQRGNVINENYYYLGLKSTTNNIFIGNPTKNAISNLYEAIRANRDILPIKEAFTTLELKPEFKLIYKPGINFKFLQNDEFWENKNLTSQQFIKSFTSHIKLKNKNNNRVSRRIGVDKIENILNDIIQVEAITDFLKENIRLITALDNKEIMLKPSLNFEEKDSQKSFLNYIQPFQLLADLELISFARFDIKKLENNFSFDDASSGEYHIILTLLNILSLIEENSLVMLDEPEISLHPNWQIKYIDIFNKVFKSFSKTHFIIATHSHFLVSDLKSSNSHIIGMDLNEQGEIELLPTQKNTYGWSAEQILLDVFKVATTRNYYISKVITDVLKEMAEFEPNYQLIKSKLDLIIFLDTKDFNEHDPLLNVFKELKKFYNELN